MAELNSLRSTKANIGRGAAWFYWVVFDLDGTLIESEQIWADVRRDFVLAHGGRWNGDAQDRMIGMRTEEWATYIHHDLGVELPSGTIAGEVVQAMIDRLSASVPVLPGAEAALERLGNACVLGLATSANLRVAQTVLEKTGWESRFRVVVSADEVARGKPSPDVYLRAIERLGADPSHAACVEDSANGIRSGRAAGLTVIAIPNRAFPPDDKSLSLAACIVESLDKLDVNVLH